MRAWFEYANMYKCPHQDLNLDHLLKRELLYQTEL